MTQRTNDHHDYSRFASTNRHCQPHGRNANAGYSGVHDGGVDPVLVSVIENAVSSSTKHSIYIYFYQLEKVRALEESWRTSLRICTVEGL